MNWCDAEPAARREEGQEEENKLADLGSAKAP